MTSLGKNLDLRVADAHEVGDQIDKLVLVERQMNGDRRMNEAMLLYPFSYLLKDLQRFLVSRS